MLVLFLVSQPFFSEDRYWPARQWVFDQYQRIEPRSLPEVERVRIVDIDEESLKQFGQWPWPRTRIVQLIDEVMKRKAIALGLDIIFAEPDRMSPDRFAEHYPDLSADLRGQLNALPPSDELFADVAAGYNIVVARAGMTDEAIGNGGSGLAYPFVRIKGEDPRERLPEVWPGVLANVQTIEDAARWYGTVNRYDTFDGTVRRVPVVARVGEGVMASLALETIRAAVDDPALTLVGDEHGMRGVEVAGELFETNPDGSIHLYFAPDNPSRRVSARRLLGSGESLPDDAFAGQVVLVGVTGLGTVDAPPTPIASRMDGVELQAQLVDNLLMGTRLSRPRNARALEAAALVLPVLLLVLALPLIRPLAGFILALALGAAVVGWGYGEFALARRLLDPTYPLAGLVSVFVAVLSSMLAEGLRHRRALNAALERERLANARLAGELDAARDIQMGILPDTSAIENLPPSLDVHAMLEPAREVGGDLYDVFMLDEHRLFFVVGDVTGKGVPASLFMAISKALCRSVAIRVDGSAADKLSVTNDEISRENPAMLFVTMVAGVIDARDGTLDFCVAGHDAPCLLRDGSAPLDLLSEGGPPLCALDDFPYPTERYQLTPGDTLMLITDGVTEAMDADGNMYGRDQMIEFLHGEHEARGRGPKALVDALYAAVKRHGGDAEPSDDVTMMAIRYRGGEQAERV